VNEAGMQIKITTAPAKVRKQVDSGKETSRRRTGKKELSRSQRAKLFFSELEHFGARPTFRRIAIHSRTERCK
jgi:hypothetical protein